MRAVLGSSISDKVMTRQQPAKQNAQGHHELVAMSAADARLSSRWIRLDGKEVRKASRVGGSLPRQQTTSRQSAADHQYLQEALLPSMRDRSLHSLQCTMRFRDKSV